MFDLQPYGSRPSSYEIHLRARRARGQAMGMLSRHAVSQFAASLCMLACNGGVRLARQLAAERRLRRDIRALRQLEDRELSDLGLGRSEIEHVVRGAQQSLAEAPPHPAQRPEPLSA